MSIDSCEKGSDSEFLPMRRGSEETVISGARKSTDFGV